MRQRRLRPRDIFGVYGMLGIGLMLVRLQALGVLRLHGFTDDLRASTASKRAEHRTQHEDNYKRDNYADDHRHHHIEIAFLVGQAADAQQ